MCSADTVCCALEVIFKNLPKFSCYAQNICTMLTFTNVCLNVLPVSFICFLFTWYSSTKITLDNSYTYLPLCLETECLYFQRRSEKAAEKKKKKKRFKNWLEASQKCETILFSLCLITVIKTEYTKLHIKQIKQAFPSRLSVPEV